MRIRNAGYEWERKLNSMEQVTSQDYFAPGLQISCTQVFRQEISCLPYLSVSNKSQLRFSLKFGRKHVATLRKE